MFRDLPLTSIHPLAMRAAVVASEAGSSSEFWRIHDMLYKGESLDENAITRAQRALNRRNGLPAAEAAQRTIRASIAAAGSLGIQGTPTFVLLCPHGIVRRIASIDQVGMFVSPRCTASEPCVGKPR